MASINAHDIGSRDLGTLSAKNANSTSFTVKRIREEKTQIKCAGGRGNVDLMKKMERRDHLRKLRKRWKSGVVSCMPRLP